MSLFTGTGACPGVAIAAAARLKVEYGVASFDPARLRRIAARLRAFGVESPESEQVILVADTLPPGFAAASLGLEVIGLALGTEHTLVPAPSLPAVIGLGDDFFESVAEDEIIIVDGSRGRVYISPDAMTVARYQAPARSARRIFLDSGHLAARTVTDGRAVAVFCPVETYGDIDTAMTAGADGIYLPSDSLLLGGSGDPMSAKGQRSTWEKIAPKIGGLPLLLAVPLEHLSLTALARGAAHGPVQLVVTDRPERDDISARLADVENSLDEKDITYGTADFARMLTAESTLPTLSELEGFAGLFVPEDSAKAGMASLLPIASLARTAQRPLTFALDTDWREHLPTALALGASRVTVPACDVEEAKEAIRAW
jgi:hypothetical protein